MDIGMGRTKTGATTPYLIQYTPINTRPEETPHLEYTRLTATPQLLQRVDLSYNGVDLNCSHPTDQHLTPCQNPTAVLFLCREYLWPACEPHAADIAAVLELMPEELWDTLTALEERQNPH